MCPQRGASHVHTEKSGRYTQPHRSAPWSLHSVQAPELSLLLSALGAALLSAAIVHQRSASVPAQGSVSTRSQPTSPGIAERMLVLLFG